MIAAMPTSRLAATLLMPLLILAGEGWAQPVKVDAEIVLAVDTSGSVDGEERRIQREGYADALRHPDLMRAITAGRHGRIAISYFEWAGQVREASVIPWWTIDGPESAAALADQVERPGGPSARGTSLSRALEFAVGLLEGSGFAADKRIIDISGDGPNNVGPPVTPARDRAVARGITVNGLPVLVRPTRGLTELDRYYEDCVIGGDGAFVLPVHSREELSVAIRRKLILEVSGVAGPERLQLAAEPIDCMIGERLRRNWLERY
jgi:Protein of unknown function (DUF1194)